MIRRSFHEVRIGNTLQERGQNSDRNKCHRKEEKGGKKTAEQDSERMKMCSVQWNKKTTHTSEPWKTHLAKRYKDPVNLSMTAQKDCTLTQKV